jgi:hypothetical protein
MAGQTRRADRERHHLSTAVETVQRVGTLTAPAAHKVLEDTLPGAVTQGACHPPPPPLALRVPWRTFSRGGPVCRSPSARAADARDQGGPGADRGGRWRLGSWPQAATWGNADSLWVRGMGCGAQAARERQRKERAAQRLQAAQQFMLSLEEKRRAFQAECDDAERRIAEVAAAIQQLVADSGASAAAASSPSPPAPPTAAAEADALPPAPAEPAPEAAAVPEAAEA